MQPQQVLQYAQELERGLSHGGQESGKLHADEDAKEGLHLLRVLATQDLHQLPSLAAEGFAIANPAAMRWVCDEIRAYITTLSPANDGYWPTLSFETTGGNAIRDAQRAVLADVLARAQVLVDQCSPPSK